MRTTDNITANREIKSDMFCMLFSEKARALELSNAFEHGNEQSHMALWAQMRNINTGHNKELMDKCSSLREYSFFMERIRANQEFLLIPTMNSSILFTPI